MFKLFGDGFNVNRFVLLFNPFGIVCFNFFYFYIRDTRHGSLWAGCFVEEIALNSVDPGGIQEEYKQALTKGTTPQESKNRGQNANLYTYCLSNRISNQELGKHLKWNQKKAIIRVHVKNPNEQKVFCLSGRRV